MASLTLIFLGIFGLGSITSLQGAIKLRRMSNITTGSSVCRTITNMIFLKSLLNPYQLVTKHYRFFLYMRVNLSATHVAKFYGLKWSWAHRRSCGNIRHPTELDSPLQRSDAPLGQAKYAQKNQSQTCHSTYFMYM